MSGIWYKRVSKKKDIFLVLLLSFITSILFTILSVVFVALTNYNPLKNYFLLNILVWGIEFSIAYFFVMGLSWLICRKIKIVNKRIIYVSLLTNAIIISLLPGGFESVYVSTFFGIISFFGLIQVAYKQKEITFLREEKLKKDGNGEK